MDIGENWHAHAVFDACEHAESLSKPWSTERSARRPIRFVVGSLEDKRHPQPPGQLGEFGCQGGGVGFAFDDTWTRHQHEGPTAADRDVSNRESWHGSLFD